MTSRLTNLPFTESGIYHIKNKINGKVYIGCASVFGSRWDKHKHLLRRNRHHSEHLQNSWNKYGEEAFEFKVLKLCPIEKLAEEETKYFESTKCQDREFGFNVAGPGSHRVVSEETKAKIGRAFKGKKLTEEHVQKIKDGLRGVKFPPITEETRERLKKSAARRASEVKKVDRETLSQMFNLYGTMPSRKLSVKLGISRGHIKNIVLGKVPCYQEDIRQLRLELKGK